MKPTKTRCNGTWTEARYWSFIRSALRRAFTRYPVGYKLRNQERKKYEGPNKLQKWTYQCKECGTWTMQKHTCVDHIIPCGTLKRYEDLPGFVERLFCEADQLQILCKKCHSTKTQNERKNSKV